MPEEYLHVERDAQAIDSTGPVCTLDPSYDTRTISLFLNASEATDFALEVKFGAEDEWVEMDTFTGTDSLSEAFDLPAFAHRLVVTTAATAGATADVKIGAR
jgi:hypothetical protein